MKKTLIIQVRFLQQVLKFCIPRRLQAHLVDFDDGKYSVRPMDPSWALHIGCILKVSSLYTVKNKGHDLNTD